MNTSNSDSANTRTDYLTFTVDRNVDVYVAYDSAATTLPSWLLSEFIDTGLSINVSNSSAPLLRLYKKSFIYGVDTLVDGSIQLGGNLAGGAAGAGANYVVIVK